MCPSSVVETFACNHRRHRGHCSKQQHYNARCRGLLPLTFTFVDGLCNECEIQCLLNAQYPDRAAQAAPDHLHNARQALIADYQVRGFSIDMANSSNYSGMPSATKDAFAEQGSPRSAFYNRDRPVTAEESTKDPNTDPENEGRTPSKPGISDVRVRMSLPETLHDSASPKVTPTSITGSGRNRNERERDSSGTKSSKSRSSRASQRSSGHRSSGPSFNFRSRTGSLRQLPHSSVAAKRQSLARMTIHSYHSMIKDMKRLLHGFKDIAGDEDAV